METETSPLLESESTISGFDAALIRGYWLSTKNDQTNLSLRSRLAVRAGASLYKSGAVKELVLAIGKEWGNDQPSVADLMKQELLKKYGINEQAVKVIGDALNSEAETLAFLKYAAEHQYRNLIDLSFSIHQRTLKTTYRHSDLVPEFTKVEDVLKFDDNPHVKTLINRLGNSKYQLGYQIYEGAKYIVAKIRPDKLNTGYMKRGRKPGVVSPMDSLGLPMDIYSLPKLK